VSIRHKLEINTRIRNTRIGKTGQDRISYCDLDPITYKEQEVSYR